MKYIRIFAAFVATLGLLSACEMAAVTPFALPEQPELESAQASALPTETLAATEIPATLAPTEEVVPTAEVVADEEVGFSLPGVNPLTGLTVEDPSLLERRPIAVKISNYPRSVRPQWGLSLADIVYEYYHNNDLTRFYAIFYGNDANLAGPIRSGRIFDSYLTSIYENILIFASADFRVLERIDSEHPNWQLVPLLDGRCPPRPVCRITPGKDGFLVADTSTAGEYAEDEGGDNERPALEGMTFDGDVPSGGEDVDTVYTHYSFSSYNYWRYDQDTGRYLRYQDSQEAIGARGEGYMPLRDQLTSTQVAADNVVVIYVDHFHFFYRAATETVPMIEVVDMEFEGHGLAYLFRDGQAYELEWVREDGQVVYLVDANGERFPFKPGTTWFQVVHDDSELERDDTTWRFEFIFRRP
jgi:hypothetical protein